MRSKAINVSRFRFGLVLTLGKFALGKENTNQPIKEQTQEQREKPNSTLRMFLFYFSHKMVFSYLSIKVHVLRSTEHRIIAGI